MMKVSDTADTYLIDYGGELLYSGPNPDAVGSSIFEILPELETRLNTLEEGKLAAAGRLVAYAPISLGNKNWFMVIATPNQDLIDLIAPVNVRILTMLLLVSVTMLILTLAAARDKKIQIQKRL